MSVKIISIIAIIIFTVELNCQQREVDPFSSDVILNYSIAQRIYSEDVQDSFYIFIKMPKNYAEATDNKYPAIILLDGDITFPMAWSTIRYLQYGKYVPDVIIIGIGYGGLLSSGFQNHRERDYTPTVINGITKSGGGQYFLSFIQNEFLPYIEKEYRVDKNNLTLWGHSLGGLFVLYSLFSEPLLFKNYIASSPYIFYDLDNLMKLEEKNSAEIEAAAVNLFISYGELEDKKYYADPISKIVSRIYDRGGNYLNHKLKVFQNGVHFSTPSEALVYGLMNIFK